MYITLTDYCNYTGTDPPENFPALAELASDMIDQLTGYKLRVGVDNLDDFKRTQVIKSTCAQAQWIDQQGGMDGIFPSCSSASLGKFSYTSNGNSSLSFSPLAMRYLASAGLLYAGVDVL